jgi:hypothetical protein
VDWYTLDALRCWAHLWRLGLSDDVLVRYWHALEAGAPDVGGLVRDSGQQSEQGSEHGGDHCSILPA